MKKKKRKETTLWRTTEQALFSPRCKIKSLFKTDFLRNRPPESTCPTAFNKRPSAQARASSNLHHNGNGLLSICGCSTQRTGFTCFFGVFVQSISFLWCFAITVTGDSIRIKSFHLPLGHASPPHLGQPKFPWWLRW